MQQEIVTSEDKEKELKWKLAEALLRTPTNPFQAAMKVCYNDTVAALTILQNWQHSEELARMQEHLIEQLGEEAFLPTEAEMVRDVLTRAEHAEEDSDYCRLMALAFDVRGMTSKAKAGPSVVVNNQTNNKIMHIPVMVNSLGSEITDEEWEQSLIDQQQRLTDGA